MSRNKKVIKEKRYYKIKFTLKSPLAIGDGSNYTTDRDIVRDSKGVPYIPASAIAGVSRVAFLKDDNLIKEYFGKVDINTDVTNSENQDKKNKASKLVFYDAKMSDKADYHISVRDSVALDDHKTALDGAKFDMEVLEPGVEFTTYIEQNVYKDLETEQDVCEESDIKQNVRKDSETEQNMCEESEKNIAKEIAYWWLQNKIYLGGKVMRGYGAIGNVLVYEKKFSIDGDVSKWLSFDMYNEDSWSDASKVVCDKICDDGMVSVKLKLKQNSGISIRKYTTKYSEDNGETMPDSEQLVIHLNGKEIPVIPGTSWAGAFSHRMKDLVSECKENDFFGSGVKKNDEEKDENKENKGKSGEQDNNENKKIRSKIRFGETQLEGAKSKIMTRNAIDRFSGGTANQALFTEKTYYGGKGDLKIEIKKECLSKNVAKALAAAITDLHMGFLAVGGLTAIGRGLFKVEEINVNGKVVDWEENTMYSSIVNALGGVN